MQSNRRAFTLIELLVVIAIIAILAAILFPVFAQAKTAAKRTQDLSNIKNLGLCIVMYTGDNDDILPPTRIVSDGAGWANPALRVTWKDLTVPYIKSGGRLPNPSGNGLYSARGDGGIFQSPLNEAAWSDANQSGFPGDETTRFPRSYAVNKDAGRNEFGGPKGDRCADTIWPEVYDRVYNQGGNQSILQSPAATAMLVPTRVRYPDAEVSGLGMADNGNGSDPGGSSQFPASKSLVASSGNGLVSFVFFDGHAKTINAYQSIDKDVWGSAGTGGIPACGWNVWWGSPNQGKPWFEGIKANMRQIKEWNP
jgi:prepilin-type N-terminal cleavage/methylation domain-containing protein